MTHTFVKEGVLPLQRLRVGGSGLFFHLKTLELQRTRVGCRFVPYEKTFSENYPKTDMVPTWRIIPVSKWLVTPIYKPFRPFIRGITPVRGLTNHGY